ncbi:uncharacterized protein UTRI_02969 [Ustilago trichophora]|uniref:F-box domain-containing protein n=1 Tax=Ustilago trichophora TaxID=86804 RepID=A0A5C3EPN8_9BASI|nr:uncharacterized protein UTRI_02969 [Ustilago trichophora]
MMEQDAASHPPCSMEQLPHEVLLDILSYLDAASLALTAATSTRIRHVALQDLLWKPFIARAVHSLSPPVRALNIHPLESTLSLWHPAFGLQADVVHPSSWPTLNEYLQDDTQPSAVDGAPTVHQELDLSLFNGATSLYDVYIRFVRKAEPLLGWWASDVPFYGMVVRIVLDLDFSYDVEHETASPDAESSSRDTPAHENAYVKRRSPSLVCQSIYPTNRLRGLDRDMERWSEVTGFPMPSNSAMIGQGTILRRSLTQISTDLLEPGIRTEDLWHFSWDDVQRGLPVPSDASSTSTMPETAIKDTKANEASDIRAHISSPSWLRSLGPQDGSERGVRSARRTDAMDDENEELELFEDDAEQIDRILRRAAEAPAFFNFGFDLEEDELAHTNLRRLIMGPDRHTIGDRQHRESPQSSAVSTRVGEDDASVQVSLPPWQPYIDADQRNAVYANPPTIATPVPPIIFPPPALLPAIRSPPWSRLGKVQIGMSDIWEAMSADRRWLIEGERLKIDSLTMSPPPPYRRWSIHLYALESGPRFFPIRNPDRESRLSKPMLKRSPIEAETAASASLASFAPDIVSSTRASASTAPVRYQHLTPPPQHDPAHVDFDWDAIEGLYSMTYGPHGIELVYVRARELTSLDFEPDDRLPAWPAEPLLSNSYMYEQTRINRHSAARVGARVLEAVKVLGDPNIPRGQVTWRAFIDDPGRSAVAWRPPPEGYLKHTPWPLRPNHAVTSQDERSPGLVLPAHGRVAEEGFVDAGWATALACISSIDEIQLWWQPMYKISVAKRLIGV